jgi:hypothetical protein
VAGDAEKFGLIRELLVKGEYLDMATIDEMNELIPASREALQEAMDGLTASQREGAEVLYDWLKEWYLKVGYKRLLAPKFDGIMKTGLPGSD